MLLPGSIVRIDSRLGRRHTGNGASLNPQDRAAKENALKAADNTAWVWNTEKKMPPLPEAAPRSASARSERTASSATESQESLSHRAIDPSREGAPLAKACRLDG